MLHLCTMLLTAPHLSTATELSCSFWKMMPKLSFYIDAIWQYFEAGHGKGPCNGPIGTAKCMADQAIQRGTASTQSTDDCTTLVLGQQLRK